METLDYSRLSSMIVDGKLEKKCNNGHILLHKEIRKLTISQNRYIYIGTKITNVKRSGCGSSAHPQLFLKRSILKTNEFKTFVNAYLF